MLLLWKVSFIFKVQKEKKRTEREIPGCTKYGHCNVLGCFHTEYSFYFLLFSPDFSNPKLSPHFDGSIKKVSKLQIWNHNQSKNEWSYIFINLASELASKFIFSQISSYFGANLGFGTPSLGMQYDPFYAKIAFFYIFFFLFIFRCLYYSIFSHDGTWGNAIITFGTRNRSENENRFIRCLESSESTAGWNRTWLYCSSHDRWLLLQCHYCLVPILPLQLIIGRNNENNLHIIMFEKLKELL